MASMCSQFALNPDGPGLVGVYNPDIDRDGEVAAADIQASVNAILS